MIYLHIWSNQDILFINVDSICVTGFYVDEMLWELTLCTQIQIPFGLSSKTTTFKLFLSLMPILAIKRRHFVLFGSPRLRTLVESKETVLDLGGCFLSHSEFLPPEHSSNSPFLIIKLNDSILSFKCQVNYLWVVHFTQKPPRVLEKY